MNYNKLLIKTENELKLGGFTKATKKTYLFNIKKYLEYLKKTILNPDKVSAKKYLLYLHNKKLTSISIRIIVVSIFFEKDFKLKN